MSEFAGDPGQMDRGVASVSDIVDFLGSLESSLSVGMDTYEHAFGHESEDIAKYARLYFYPAKDAALEIVRQMRNAADVTADDAQATADALHDTNEDTAHAASAPPVIVRRH